MSFLDLLVMIVLLLTLTVVVLSFFAVVSRALANRRERRIGRRRSELLAATRQYLIGEKALADVTRIAPRNREVTLGALLSAAADLPAKHYPPLHALAEALGLAQHQLETLRHRDWTRRAHAATWLGVLRYPAATAPLIAALEDEMLDVRLAAAHALAQLGALDAVQPILRSLALPVAWPLQRCAEILFEMGTPVVQPLLAAHAGGRLPVPATTVVIRVLGMLQAPTAIPVLLKYARHPDTEVRVSTVKALGQIGTPRSLATLREALADPEWPVRAAAASALARLRDRSAVPALAARLADPAWWVRFNAAEALYRLDAGAELQSAASGHADRFARDISRQVLEEYGPALAAPSRAASLGASAS